jgi:hypothetical protein
MSISTPPSISKMRTFFKIGHGGYIRIILLQFRLQPPWPIFDLQPYKQVVFSVVIIGQIGWCR